MPKESSRSIFFSERNDKKTAHKMLNNVKQLHKWEIFTYAIHESWDCSDAAPSNLLFLFHYGNVANIVELLWFGDVLEKSDLVSYAIIASTYNVLKLLIASIEKHYGFHFIKLELNRTLNIYRFADLIIGWI